MLPPQLFFSAAENAVSGAFARSAGRLAALAAMTLIVHVFGLAVFRRVLDSPVSAGGVRGGRMHGIWARRLPGLSSGASAVALTHLRLALRTPRGRSVLISPVVLFAFFGFLMYRGSGAVDFGPFQFKGGVSLAALMSFFCLLSVVPISMNQFAIDRAGLTMALLSPLSEAELLAGKAVGNALIGLTPSLLCYLAALLMFPGGAPALWISVPIGLIAVYLVVAPVAAIASAAFPKTVDLNSVGGNNAPWDCGVDGDAVVCRRRGAADAARRFWRSNGSAAGACAGPHHALVRGGIRHLPAGVHRGQENLLRAPRESRHARA